MCRREHSRSDSDSHLERVRLRLSRYVPNPSFDRAQALLDKAHFCIVAGIPGIGKTTLAEVLLADLVDRQGFAAFRIAHDLSELRSIKNLKSKQVFYFDDFLGKTALDKLQKNEDQRLVELMEEVSSNSNENRTEFFIRVVDELDPPGRRRWSNRFWVR